MTTEPTMLPAEAAACLFFDLSRQGAVFTLNRDTTFFHVDLNPCKSITNAEEAERVSAAILGLRDEIRLLLLNDTEH